MVLPPHSSHLTQPLDIGVFKPLKTCMTSAIEPLISTELHRILKAEWLSAYVKAYDNAFTIANIHAGFYATGIQPFDPSKVIDRVKPFVKDSIVQPSSLLLEPIMPFKDSVLISSPLNTNDVKYWALPSLRLAV